MKLKKIMFPIFAITMLFFITSCSYVNDFINNIGNNTNISSSTNTITTKQVDKKYTVIWVNDDGTELKKVENVKSDSIPSYDLDVPTKKDDEKYQYTFNKWVETKDEENNIITYTASYNRLSKINSEIKDWGYVHLQSYENKAQLISLYDDMNLLCKDFYEGKTESNQVNVNGEIQYTVGENIEYTSYNLSTDEAASVYSCIMLDHPEYYFSMGAIMGSSTQTISEGGIVVDTIVKNFINVSIHEEYKSKEVRLEYLNKINEYVSTVSNLVKLETDNVKKVKYIHDYIINNAKYAFKEDGTTPDDSSYAHNILGIIINKKGVCESYSELFQLLLIKNGINCVKVTGEAITNGNPEDHAWNYAEVDGSWYAFDVTWDDPVSSSGKDTITHKYFGKGSKNQDFMNSHIPATQGDMTYRADYLYTLPVLSEDNINYLYLI
ncbi:MAG: hypothetical protein IJS83_05755 [Acholeplasmatales bacterium]|nr:hypothetical protein [Acholeplasmatales bacterium]